MDSKRLNFYNIIKMSDFTIYHTFLTFHLARRWILYSRG